MDLVHEAAAASNHVHGPTFALREQDVASTDGGHIETLAHSAPSSLPPAPSPPAPTLSNVCGRPREFNADDMSLEELTVLVERKRARVEELEASRKKELVDEFERLVERERLATTPWN